MAVEEALDAMGVRTVVEHIRPARGNLYAVLDSARSTRVLTLMRSLAERHESLYEGVAGRALAAWAPYLVLAPADGRFCRELLREGWGRSWGSFIQTTATFERLRRHLRRFLIVANEAGKKHYFRYYDPRVLRELLPIATPRQVVAMFEDVDAFVVEGQDGRTLLRFEADDTRATAAVHDVPQPNEERLRG